MNFHELPAGLQLLQNKLFEAVRSGRLCAQSGDVGFASAPSNIALLKYWGKRRDCNQVPVNPSVSYRLGRFRSRTRVQILGRMFPENDGILPPHAGERPPYVVNLENSGDAAPSQKMQSFLERLLAGWADHVGLAIASENNFPTACGVASSASGYAALVGAIANAFGVEQHLSPAEFQHWLIEWARLGSGSAARSAWLGPEPFVTFTADAAGNCHSQAFIAATELNSLAHLLLIVSTAAKTISSSAGHASAHTSPLQQVRVAGLTQRFSQMQSALAENRWNEVAALAEEDAFSMHAVMQTQVDPQHYLTGETARLVALFVTLRNACRAQAFWTLDAGANLHLLALSSAVDFLAEFVDAAFAAGFRFEGILRGDAPEPLQLGDGFSPNFHTSCIPATGASVRRLFS